MRELGSEKEQEQHSCQVSQVMLSGTEILDKMDGRQDRNALECIRGALLGIAMAVYRIEDSLTSKACMGSEWHLPAGLLQKIHRRFLSC